MQQAQLNRTRVRVQHADAIVSAGLVAALAQQGDFELCDGSEADLIVCDYDNSLALARALGRDGRGRVLALTGQNREQAIRLALECGVHGYLLQGCQVDELVMAARAVARGQRFLGQEVAQRIAESMSHEALTQREAEVLALLADGHCNKSIARQLEIALGTVKTHVKAIMAKLQAGSRTQAVAVATQRGLVVTPLRRSEGGVEQAWA